MNKEIGCKNCPAAPTTYEEFCLAKHSVDTSFCQDAFEEQAKKCNLYNHNLLPSKYDKVNCNECENETCTYREEDGKPYYCPGVEGDC